MEERARVTTVVVVVFWFLVTVLALYLGLLIAHPRLSPAMADWVIGVWGGCATGEGFTSGSDEGSGTVSVRGCLQIARDALAIMAFFVGATWASWIFFSGRPLAAYATLDVEAVEVWRHPAQGARALVRVSVRNTGRVRLIKQSITVMVRPVDELQLRRSTNPLVAETGWTKQEEDEIETLRQDIFTRMEEDVEVSQAARRAARKLDPGSEIAEQVLVFFGDRKALKVQVEFIARPKIPIFGKFPFRDSSRTYRGWALLHAAQVEDREEELASNEEEVATVAQRIREELDQQQRQELEGIVRQVLREEHARQDARKQGPGEPQSSFSTRQQ